MAIEANRTSTNAAIDITKLIMAVLVIGIHTEPFGFCFWLDKGFAIITRLCVPFFFISSSFLFWSKERSPWLYIRRLLILYLVWSLIYLPFDLQTLSHSSAIEILERFLWDGNEHALWYLWASVVGFLITYLLLKVLSPGIVVLLGLTVLVIGCLKSTWSPVIEAVFSRKLPDYLGTRNGLFYAFPYYSLGMFLARRFYPKAGNWSRRFFWIGFGLSVLALIAESILLVIKFDTQSTILWLSVFPMSFFFFWLVLTAQVNICDQKALLLRKMSTLLFVSHNLPLLVFKTRMENMRLFLVVLVCSTLFSMLIIYLAERKRFSLLRYLY